MFWRCFGGVSEVFRGCFEGVLRCFEGVLEVIFNSYDTTFGRLLPYETLNDTLFRMGL